MALFSSIICLILNYQNMSLNEQTQITYNLTLELPSVL